MWTPSQQRSCVQPVFGPIFNTLRTLLRACRSTRPQSSSFAELRWSGSHCSILRIRRKKASLSSRPASVVSLSSSGRACGTGIVASALIFAANEDCEGPVTVLARGGNELHVTFERTQNQFRNVTLTGPAEFVFEGTIEI